VGEWAHDKKREGRLSSSEEVGDPSNAPSFLSDELSAFFLWVDGRVRVFKLRKRGPRAVSELVVLSAVSFFSQCDKLYLSPVSIGMLRKR